MTPQSNGWPSSALLRSVGYGLLILAFFDFIDIIFPPRLMNPTWEFQTMGSLVERVAVPLIGLVLVFYGEASARVRWERAILRLLSWIALLIGVLFLLLIPLTLSSASRLNDQNKLRIDTEYNQRISQIQQLKSQANKATDRDVEAFLKRQGLSTNGQSSQESKKRLLSEITRAETRVGQQAKAARASTSRAFFKDFAKWNIGAVVAGVLFIRIWQVTRWARVSKRKSF